MYHLAKRARQDVTVVLSGEGGDEILSGYPIYRTMTALDRSHALRGAAGLAFVARRLGGHVRSEKLAKYLDWVGSDLGSSYKGVTNDVTRSVRERFYDDGFSAQVGDAVSLQYRELFDKLEHGGPLNRMAYIDFKSWLPDNQLIKTDKMTMAASLELRVPLLDHKLVEFCMTLPESYRLRGHHRQVPAQEDGPAVVAHGRHLSKKSRGFPRPSRSGSAVYCSIGLRPCFWTSVPPSAASSARVMSSPCCCATAPARKTSAGGS